MTRLQRLRFEMFVRVNHFGNTYRDRFPPTSPVGQAFATVAEVVAEIEATTATSLRVAAESRRTRTAVRRALRTRMAGLARTARVLVRRNPDAGRVFRLPRKQSDTTLLAAAHAFIKEAEAGAERYGRLGVTPEFIADLRARADALEQAMELQRTGRNGVTAARVALRAAFARGTEAVDDIGLLIGNMVNDDPLVVALWQRNRRVHTVGKGVAADEAHPAAESADTRTEAAVPVPSVEPVAATPAPGDALEKAS